MNWQNATSLSWLIGFCNWKESGCQTLANSIAWLIAARPTVPCREGCCWSIWFISQLIDCRVFCQYARKRQGRNSDQFTSPIIFVSLNGIERCWKRPRPDATLPPFQHHALTDNDAVNQFIFNSWMHFILDLDFSPPPPPSSLLLLLSSSSSSSSSFNRKESMRARLERQGDIYLHLARTLHCGLQLNLLKEFQRFSLLLLSIHSDIVDGEEREGEREGVGERVKKDNFAPSLRCSNLQRCLPLCHVFVAGARSWTARWSGRTLPSLPPPSHCARILPKLSSIPHECCNRVWWFGAPCSQQQGNGVSMPLKWRRAESRNNRFIYRQLYVSDTILP